MLNITTVNQIHNVQIQMTWLKVVSNSCIFKWRVMVSANENPTDVITKGLENKTKLFINA